MANNKGFKLLLRGELWLLKDPGTAWQLPSCDPVVEVDLEETLKDPVAFKKAALAIGTLIMDRGVRYAAEGVRKWERTRPRVRPLDPSRARARSTLARLKG